MSVATEILSLRRNQFSSMTTLLSAIDRYWKTQCDEHVVGRKYAVYEAADMLLINVAAHAAEALSEPLATNKTRRAVVPFRRKPRRSGLGRLHQVVRLAPGIIQSETQSGRALGNRPLEQLAQPGKRIPAQPCK